MVTEEQGLAEESKRDVNLRTAQLVQLLTEVGPDIPEIARKLGQFKESVRYRYKEKILKNDFVVQANADSGKLGLTRVTALVDFDPLYKNYAQAILAAMASLTYLQSFGKTLPNGSYVVNANVPNEHVQAYTDFMTSLRTKGLFRTVELYTFDWSRRIPMKSEYYDFNTGRWDFTWDASGKPGFETAAYSPSGPAKFDQVDLLIIQQLQFDANKTLKEIADKLKIHYKKLAWHYLKHVVGERLISSYAVRWVGTRYDIDLDKAMHKRHRYLALTLIAHSLSDIERMSLASKISKLPFAWFEAGGNNYYAELFLPMELVTEGMQYIESTIESVRDKTQFFIIDQTSGAGFTITPEHYDEKQRQWDFNSPELSLRFDNLLLKIKEGGE
jgi:hypothetical protein